MREAANAAVMNVVVAVSDPVFRSMDGALWFAFNFKHGTVKPSALAQMMSSKAHKSRGLGGLDGAGQAGMIKSEVMALGPVRSNILAARFSPNGIPCSCRAPCCQGYKPNPEWSDAIEILSGQAMTAALAGKVSNYRLRMGIVARYFGVRASLPRLAEECGVHKDTASVHNSAVGAWLGREEQLARYDIEGRLKMAGIIE